jgi:hypothetical protein
MILENVQIHIRAVGEIQSICAYAFKVLSDAPYLKKAAMDTVGGGKSGHDDGKRGKHLERKLADLKLQAMYDIGGQGVNVTNALAEIAEDVI